MDGAQSRKAVERNLFKRRPLLVKISAFGQSKSLLILAYRILIFFILFYLFTMAAFAIYFTAPNKVLMASALHVVLITTFVIFITACRYVTARSIHKTNKLMKSGIYEYTDEELDENLLNMKTSIDKEVNKTSNFFSAMFATGGVCNITIYPWTTLLIDMDDKEDSIVNPYLPPYLIYMPFTTRTISGYCLAYLINVILVIYLYGITLCWLDIYIHCAVVLKVQLQMLNYSIKNLQNRAYAKFKERNRNISHEYSAEALNEEKGFQSCLYSCFRSNVQHHQALLRFKRALKPFLGAGLLDMYLMAALIYAATLYLIVQDLPVNQVVNLALMLFTEQSKLFIMCHLGEAISNESTGLFDTLYHLPWNQCNEHFKKAVSIMMCNTLQPLKLKAIIIDKPADIRAYGDFMTTMYKIVNLVRQSDVT